MRGSKRWRGRERDRQTDRKSERREWSMCSNAATQLLASCAQSINLQRRRPMPRLFAALRRRTPGNERLHLIRRKWKRNHAQKTPTGGSRRVRYSASVRRSTAVLVGRGETSLNCGSHTETFFGRLYYCLIVPLHVARLYRPLLYFSSAPLAV